MSLFDNLISGLVYINKNALKAAVIALPITFSGCKPDPVEPDNRSPVSTLTLDKYSGLAPLDVGVSGVAHDADGDSDITNYGMVITNKTISKVDTTISSSNPIPSFNRVFKTAGTYDVVFTATDSHGATGSKSASVTVDALTLPIGTLNVSNVSGDSPLQTRLKLTGTNVTGLYELHIDDKVVSKSTPFDTLVTLYAGPHKVFGKVYGVNGSSATPVTDIDVKIVGGKWIVGGAGVAYPFPSGPVNFFVYPGDAEYNSLDNKVKRDNAIENARVTDITPNIPTGLDFIINGITYGFACGQASTLFEYNCHDWKDLYTIEFVDPRVYGWYNGENFDSIHVHGGTIKFGGSHKVPIYKAQVAPTHIMNFAVTGDDLRDGKSINFVEMMYGLSKSNVQPGDPSISLNYNGLMLRFGYTYFKDGRTWRASVAAVEYNVVGGVIQFVATNPNIEVVMTREEAKNYRK